MFELPNFRAGWMKQWLKKMKSLKMKITLSAGKPHSRRKLKKYYRQLLTNGSKAIDHLGRELQRVAEEHRPFGYLFPSRRYMLERVLEQIRQDIVDADRVIEDANERVFHGKVRGSRDKVLSLSDTTAAFIKKGGRDPVIGYKPQVGRSEHGFVTGLLVKEGNPADSAELVPLVGDVIFRTGVVPEVVSGDDGYASETGRADLLGEGVGVVSISGAKGKKLIGEEDWESEAYRDARSGRSAIESLIFVLKHCFAFGRLSRRGLEAVRAEMLEKVLAYNSCRISYVRKRKRQKLKQAAA
jgi:hypothetical protein